MKDSEMDVEESYLMPELVGVYRIRFRCPGIGNARPTFWSLGTWAMWTARPRVQWFL